MTARIAENITRDFSILAALVVVEVEVEVPPVPGTRVYLFGSTPLSLCLEISPSIELCMAHAILTSVPGYIKKYVKNFISLLF